VLYRDTPPDGVTVPVSTVEVEVFPPGSGPTTFTETISLVHSPRGATHFAVETDELLRSTIRFGNSTNGEPLAPNSKVVVSWRAGLGLDGNVGRDTLTVCADANVASVWNPFDATNGRAPERAEEVKRNAPEAYRAKQLRAVTLADYVARAEEVDGVAHAAAAYAWTGSWRTVRITIDPAGTEELSSDLADRVAAHLEALRLIGEDLEIRPPIFVPLHLELVVCVRDDVWPEEVRFEIEKELSDGWTADGRRALFHPDNWTFGQPLYESEIAGRLQRIDGIEHIAKIEIRRFDAATPGDGSHVEVGPSEIIEVHDDPDHMERGFIELTLVGGRQ
jgi:predicted phage baseplate assembly protein